MTTTRIPTVEESSLTRDALNALRYYASGRRGLLALAALALGGGLWLGWPSLVAAGIAPILLALAPCAAMCALGLCMHKMTRGSSTVPVSSPDGTSMSSAEPPSTPLAIARLSDSSPSAGQSATAGAASDENCCHSPDKRRTPNA
jgi:hypothetical protein